MALPDNVQEDRDWEAWEEFLEECPKEKLVQLLLSRMAADDNFMKLVQGYFTDAPGQEETLSELKKGYEMQLVMECRTPAPDTDYILSLSRRFLDTCESELKTADRVKGYLLVLGRTTQLLQVRGLSAELLEELIQDTGREMVAFVMDREKELSDQSAYALRVLLEEELGGTFDYGLGAPYIRRCIDLLRQ